MYKLSFAATAVSAGFFGAKDPFDNPFFNKGGFGTPEKPTEGSPFNIDFFNRPPEERLFNRERPILGGIFNQQNKELVGSAPNRWIPFLGKRENNRIVYNENDGSLNVFGSMIADAGQSMTFDSTGLNG